MGAVNPSGMAKKKAAVKSTHEAQQDAVKQALDTIKETGCSVRRAAKAHGLSFSTLQRYTSGAVQLGSRHGPPTALTPAAEEQLQDWLYNMLLRRRTPPILQVRVMAAELEAVEARAAQRQPRWPDGVASEDWWLGYKARWKLRLRSCQLDEADRIIAITPDAITAYFDMYGKMYAKYSNVNGQFRIFNMDESPVMQLGRWIKGVVVEGYTGDVKRIGGKSKGAMREMLTMVTCFSPHHLIPHAFILKGGSRKSDPLQHTTSTMPGAVFITKQHSAMIDGTLLLDWLEHFKRHVPGGVSINFPAGLLVDSHSSRLHGPFIEAARDSGIEVLLPPGNCTAEIQPCDQIFAGVKTILGTERVMFLQGGKSKITEPSLLWLLGIASQKSFTLDGMGGSWEHCGLHPLNLAKVLARLPPQDAGGAAAAAAGAGVLEAHGAGGGGAEGGDMAGVSGVQGFDNDGSGGADSGSSDGGEEEEEEEEGEEEANREDSAAARELLDVLAAAAAEAAAAADAEAVGASGGGVAADGLNQQRQAVLRLPPMPKEGKGACRRVKVPRLITSSEFQQLLADQAAAAKEKEAAVVRAREEKEAKRMERARAKEADQQRRAAEREEQRAQRLGSLEAAKALPKAALVTASVQLHQDLQQARAAAHAAADALRRAGLAVPPELADLPAPMEVATATGTGTGAGAAAPPPAAEPQQAAAPTGKRGRQRRPLQPVQAVGAAHQGRAGAATRRRTRVAAEDAPGAGGGSKRPHRACRKDRSLEESSSEDSADENYEASSSQDS